MEKIRCYLDYDLDTKHALFIGIEKNSEHAIELELTETEFVELTDNLDFIFVKNGQPLLDNSYKTKYLAKVAATNRIEELKQLLANSDWKVVVNSELIQSGLQPKYPNLHNERQAWRNEINELELKL